jgi:type IV pilus biogenesis protein CpaD/CtpE
MNIRATVLVAGLVLAACTTPANTPRPEFGQAVRNNMAAHIIDPHPPESMDLPPSDGVRRSRMIERYQADKVESPPLPVTTTLGLEAPGSK